MSKNHVSKKLLSLFCVLAIVLTLLPATALASTEEGDGEDAAVVSEINDSDGLDGAKWQDDSEATPSVNQEATTTTAADAGESDQLNDEQSSGLAGQPATGELPAESPVAYQTADFVPLASGTVSLGTSGVTDTVDRIQAALNTALLGAGSGDTITVDGSYSGSGTATTLTLTIPVGVTVRWTASYTAAVGADSLITLDGSGSFDLATGGSITNSAQGNALLATTDALTIIVSGGSASTNNSSNGFCIATPGSVSVSGGSVSIVQGKAIQAGGDVTISGGTVETTNAYSFTISTEGNVVISGGTVRSAGQGGYVVNARGTVTVSGSSTLVQSSGNSSTVIDAYGKVTVNDGTVQALGTNSSAISTLSAVEINGGTVEAVGGIAIQSGIGNVEVNAGLIRGNGDNGGAISANGDVTINGGAVEALGNYSIAISARQDGDIYLIGGTVSVTVGNALQAAGDVVVSGGAVSTTSGYAISANTVTVSSGTVQATGGGTAIICPALVTVSGGTVSAAGTGSQAIRTSYPDGSVTVSAGTVQASGSNANAIVNYGDASTSVTVSGGTVSATSSSAIYVPYSPTTISNGFVFAYGTDIIGMNNVIYYEAIAPSITGNGVVCAWNQGAGRTTYAEGSATDLTLNPAGSATWHDNSGVGGISYTKNANTGFFPLLVTVGTPVAPAITSANSATAVNGTGTTFQVAATGTPDTFAYSLTGAPAGVSINASTGLITIAATTAVGSHPFTITVANGTLPNATQSFTLTVNAAPTITSANNTSVVAGTGGTFQVTATGTPATFAYSLTGAPVGVSINASTGLITVAGTTAAGSHSFTVTVANGSLPNATQNFTLTVRAAPAITSADSTTAVNGTGTTFQVTATGTPDTFTYSLTGAPAGVSINASTGLITIAATTAVGSHPFTITVANGTTPDATQSFTLTVNAAPIITSANNTSVVNGTGGTFQVTATGAPATFAYSLTGEPAGVSIDSSTGLITIAGATAIGSHSFTVNVSNGITPNATQNFTLTVSDAPVAPAITSTNNTAVVNGTGGTFQITATGTAPISYSLAGAPTGVSIDSASGLITITGAASVGSHSFTVTAANGTLPNATQGFTLTVNAAAGPVLATSVTIGGANAITTNGGTTQLTAAIAPSDATMQTVTWSVVGGSAATVSASGLVTATANGTVTIRATTQDGSGTYGEITITVSGQGSGTTPMVYPIKEHFDDFTGSGTSDAMVDAEHTGFVRLLKAGSEIDAQHYGITQGSTIITFTEAYLKTLANGTHWYVAEFSDGTSEDIRLIVNVAATSTPVTGTPNASVPRTGDTVPPLWLAIALGGTGVVCLCAWRQRKRWQHR